MTECSRKSIEFGGCVGRRLLADFEGGRLTSDGGSFLERAVLERAVLERAVLERAVFQRAVFQRAVFQRAVFQRAACKLGWSSGPTASSSVRCTQIGSKRYAGLSVSSGSTKTKPDRSSTC